MSTGHEVVQDDLDAFAVETLIVTVTHCNVLDVEYNYRRLLLLCRLLGHGFRHRLDNLQLLRLGNLHLLRLDGLLLL